MSNTKYERNDWIANKNFIDGQGTKFSTYVDEDNEIHILLRRAGQYNFKIKLPQPSCTSTCKSDSNGRVGYSGYSWRLLDGFVPWMNVEYEGFEGLCEVFDVNFDLEAYPSISVEFIKVPPGRLSSKRLKQTLTSHTMMVFRFEVEEDHNSFK